MSNWILKPTPGGISAGVRFQVVERFSASDLAILARLYRRAGAPQPPDEGQMRWLLSESDLAVALRAPGADGELLAFARVLTDFSREAVVLDVLADPEANLPLETLRAGVVAALVEHPLLRDVARIEVRPPLQCSAGGRSPAVTGRANARRPQRERLALVPADTRD
jgi:hypothetical protein